MSLKIPYNLCVKAADFPESSPGVIQVTFILIDGREVSDVYLTREGEILKVRDKPIHGIADLGFSIFEVKDIMSGI